MVDSPIVGWGLPDEEDALLPLNYESPRLQASAVVKTGPGILYSLTMTNTNAAARYLQLFDSTQLPADGTIPIFSRSIPINDSITLFWPAGHTFLYGCIVCNSSTAASKTLGTADSIFDVAFI